MASPELSRRVGKVVAYLPLCEMSDLQRREFYEGLLDADTFEDLPGKWQAAFPEAEQNKAEAAGRQVGRGGGRLHASQTGDVSRRAPWVRGLEGQRRTEMLWLILGIILLIIAIGGGVIVHPIIFVLAIAAIVMFLMSRRYA